MDYIGIDIGGTKCAVVKGDLENGVKEKIRFATTGKDETLKNIFDAVEKLMPAVAIGISCGGPLDERTGVIMAPPNLPEWDGVPITDMLEKRFGVKAKLLNDANAGALAEWRFGAGRGSENMLFLTFGTGLGAGVILNSRLYSGTNGNAGEIGHIRLADDGPVGYGKAGSFEGFCSGGGITRLAVIMGKEALKRGEPMSFSRTEEELDGLNTKILADMAHAGDKDALSVFEASAEKLGAGLSIVIDILNPERIVIGGVYSRAEDLFLEGMHRVLKRETLGLSYGVCKIVPATLGESIGDIAALCAALEN
jgi:glucokinase